jgi:hypothetical protein
MQKQNNNTKKKLSQTKNLILTIFIIFSVQNYIKSNYYEQQHTVSTSDSQSLQLTVEYF